jgi:phage major head subunit gpT-like protein
MGTEGAYNFEGPGGAVVDEVHRTFTGYLFGALGSQARWAQQMGIAQELPVKGNEAKIKLASRPTGVHEWLDERHKQKIERADHSVAVKRWANAITVKLDDLADDEDNLGQYKPLIDSMADDFDEHRHQLFIDLIGSGFAGTLGTAYDGQFFFDTDHPVALTGGSLGTQSNKITSSFDGPALYEAMAALEALKKPSGEQANLQATHALFPVALRSAVETVLDKQYSTNGENNLLYQRVKPIFDPRLDAYSTIAWYLLDLSKGLKPFFWVDRKRVTPQMDRKDEFELGVVHWGAYGRYNASYGFYHTMIGSTGAS